MATTINFHGSYDSGYLLHNVREVNALDIITPVIAKNFCQNNMSKLKIMNLHIDFQSYGSTYQATIKYFGQTRTGQFGNGNSLIIPGINESGTNYQGFTPTDFNIKITSGNSQLYISWVTFYLQSLNSFSWPEAGDIIKASNFSASNIGASAGTVIEPKTFNYQHGSNVTVTMGKKGDPISISGLTTNDSNDHNFKGSVMTGSI